MAQKRPFVMICATPFDAGRFLDLPPSIQVEALEEIVSEHLHIFSDIAEILRVLRELCHHPDAVVGSRFRRLLVVTLVFQGHLAEAQAILDATEPVDRALQLQGWICFLRGENEKAIHAYEAVLKPAKKNIEKHKIISGTISGVFFLFALLKSENSAHRIRLAELLALVHKTPKVPSNPALRCLEAVLLAQENKTAQALAHLEGGFVDQGVDLGDFLPEGRSGDSDLVKMLRMEMESIWPTKKEDDTSLVKLFKMVARYWIDGDYARKHVHDLKALFDQAEKNGYRWVAMECAALMVALDPEATTLAEYVATIQRETGLQSLLPIVPREEGWERALKALANMGVSDKGRIAVKAGGSSRLIWIINLRDNHVTIQPREQVRSATGIWSKGRPVALKRLYRNPENLDFLTDQDRRICATIVQETNYYDGTFYEFDWSKAMLAMVGHPLVFWEKSPQINVEVVKVEPELLVKQKGGQVKVRFATPVEREGVIAIQETPTRCKLIEITTAHKRIAEILGARGLQIPVKAKEQVMQAMQAVSSLVTIHSGIGGGMVNIEEVPADATPHLHLLPHGDGLKVNLLVRPFSGDGPYFQPGKGGTTIIAEVNGKRVQTHRQFKEESNRARSLVMACPTLAGEESQTEWILEDPEACLELLLDLKTVAEQVIIAWPEGEKMRVSNPVAMDGLRVRIQRDQDWFSVTGDISLDEDLVMEMGRMLDMMRDKESRFIPLGEGRFIALTKAFRKRLSEIDAFSEKNAQGQRFHPLASPVFRELLADAKTVETDQHWRTHLKRFDQAQGLDPEPPSTLQAELRDYQVVGFRWLVRLAAWGVGACLADDMGLGKTLQALALLLYRAQEGPSLVVAPTSVALNWLTEIDRFAPTLRGVVFGGGQRQQTLDTLKPFDVVICSYGLLQQEADMLAAIRWNVIVLDEAQAIKNRLTKRSQSVMALAGSFRIIMTGTPLENHLGEVWNLFRFINPGLLGSLDVFNERFASPIERYGDKGAQKRLRKLIQPFLLRRTKSQVLEELPPRTEIILNVEMSPEEMAFYETLRRKAIEQIENLDGPVEQKRFQILAEIMRLRRACCNSRLVLPDSPIESTKLAIFWEVVEELLENRHKALVFSQFVDHLAIIRGLLDEKKVVYQYLDGSTPANERQRRVEAFQSGEGDLFLISLKAGGVGINLTAADYVIHMDPWWNPAVEDQASDRAHRIGQMRPVTIYRLVTQETIEEKIVDLHRHKRNLADGLLEGGDMSGRLSVEELLNMIRGQK
ncbi:MAG: SNF2-related protein [Magnetococcus sp. DMHC-1]